MPDLILGARAECKRSFSAEDLASYAGLAGGAPGDTVPEPLIGGMFSYLLGTRLPGPGTNYLKQRIVFLGPARPGEQLIAAVEVSRVRPEKDLIYLLTTCHGADGRLVAEGEALVLVKDVDV
ncbi:phosphate acetyltransferase [Chloroflexales bacterium ZM16-3]|nr:phosphate acetyltransferase [Chloroflexales bacterium ZM16-3]